MAAKPTRDVLTYGMATKVPKSHYDQAYKAYLDAHTKKYGTAQEPRLKEYKKPFGKEEFFRKIKAGSVIVVGRFLFHRYSVTTWRVQL
jgi:hypothetical protein